MADEFKPENLGEPKQSEMSKPAAGKHDVWRGMGVALLLHLIQVPMMAVTGSFSLAFIGLSQFVYLLPAILVYQRKKRPGVVNGLVIVAGITFLINATCTVLIFRMMTNMH